MTAEPKPFHLTFNFAPITDELDARDLPVEGELPPGLFGTYLRNGPNPRSGTSPHWFVGDGMVHGVRLEGGRARWYKNRYVGPGRDVPPEGDRLRARRRHNTHVIEHAGRILALVEAALPMELDAELGSVGLFDFDGRVDTAVTAHPKRCAHTGELHFFGYQHAAPHLTYYVADARGQVVRRQEVDVEGASYMHDFALTEHHALFFDMPVRMIGDWGGPNPMPFAWKDGFRARILAVPRAGGPTRAFEVQAGMLSHTANAYEEDGRIVVEGARTQAFDGPPPLLHRWELDLGTGAVRETQLDERVVDFPRIDDRRAGLRHRYVTTVELRVTDGKPAGSLLRRYDTDAGTSVASSLPVSEMPGECVFVPAGPDEDEGFLMSYVYDAARDGSDLVILDAGRLDGPPVARVRLPRRVPFGFHGSWVPGQPL